MALWWAARTEERRQIVCESTIEERNDDREMWLWLADYFDTPENTEGVAELRNELNDRLPRLQCVAGSAVPVRSQP